jgi:hypothetical protein
MLLLLMIAALASFSRTLLVSKRRFDLRLVHMISIVHIAVILPTAFLAGVFLFSTSAGAANAAVDQRSFVTYGDCSPITL